MTDTGTRFKRPLANSLLPERMWRTRGPGFFVSRLNLAGTAKEEKSRGRGFCGVRAGPGVKERARGIGIRASQREKKLRAGNRSRGGSGGICDAARESKISGLREPQGNGGGLLIRSICQIQICFWRQSANFQRDRGRLALELSSLAVLVIAAAT